jgi:hypothetical protein
MPARVNTHDQLIADAIAKARRLAADLERDAEEMASADPQGQRLTTQALDSAQAVVEELSKPAEKQNQI